MYICRISHQFVINPFDAAFHFKGNLSFYTLISGIKTVSLLLSRHGRRFYCLINL